MEIVFLDSDSYGEDIDLTSFNNLGNVKLYADTLPRDVKVRIEDSDIVIINNTEIGNEDIKFAKKLKLIAIAATGMNNVDLEYCKKMKIKVCNVPAYATDSVTQHTFAMLFHLLEQIEYYDSYVKSGKWSKSGSPTHLGRKFVQLKGKRWGIIGFGNIGKNVARIAESFGCEVVYYKRNNNEISSKFKGISLQKLLQSSNIISIHTPINNETRNMITKKELALIKPSSILLNLGRGGIVNEKDLAEALNNNNLMAGIDVFTQEPIEKTNPLLLLEKPWNLLLTPHIGFASKEARNAVIEGTLNNIKEFLLEQN